MNRVVWFVAFAVVAVVIAVLAWPSDHGPRPIAFGEESCARCKMILSRPGFGGELERKREGVVVYDDVGCLLEDLWGDPSAVVAGWVEDQASGALVPLGEAVWVFGEGVTTPMGHGLVGFKERAAAEAFAAQHQAPLLTLAELATLKGTFGRTAVAAAAHAEGMRPLSEADAELGKKVYQRECSACHGERGDGTGPAAAFLEPKPRDFTQRLFKLRTTPTGTPPATADVLRTLERGIPGTAMPPFTFLNEAERRQATAYVLKLAGMLDGKEPPSIPAPGTPPSTTPASVARGKEVYEAMYCHSCHGPAGKGDGPSAATQVDNQGRKVAPRDFTTGVFRGGRAREELYYRFVTGMDGSPMPAFGDNVQGDDRWALVDYVLSLEVPVPPTVYPSDALAAGRVLAQKYSCRGCHVLDDGRGGNVGPDLRVSGQKLSSDWVRGFLDAPRNPGKIYPWRMHRMPDLGLTEAEVEVGVRYLAAMGKRAVGPVVKPDPSIFPADKVAMGQGVFMLRCTECHQLGKVIETPTIKQQGPDLIHAAERVDYAWAGHWIADPKRIDPLTKMTNPGITAADVEAVRMFVWKTSMENGAQAAAIP